MTDVAGIDLDAPVHTYASGDFVLEDDTGCDLILKGGITSGIVYPHAICELAQRYRLLEVGGTSAGAMGAALAAAAEYQRQREAAADAGTPDAGHALPDRSGFLRVSKLYDVFGEPDGVFKLFQPQANLRPHFDVAVATLRAFRTPGLALWARVARVLPQLLNRFPGAALVGAVVALAPLAIVVSGAGFGGGFRMLFSVVLAVVCALTLAVLTSGIFALATAVARLREANFGLCSGMSESGGEPALTQWLHNEIQATAGLGAEAAPLTFAELSAHRINLRVITTDLAMGRPFELGLDHSREWPSDEHFGAYHYLQREFAALFPEQVVTALVDASRESDHDFDGERLYEWPPIDKLPVVVATRLSFGMPLLLQAIPLYRRDLTLPDAGERCRFQRCLLTDGGISSNLPIHFFDRAFPDRPTFAISLERHSEQRHGTAPEGRVAMFTGGKNDVADPLHARGDGWLRARRRGIAITPIPDVFTFAANILHSARNWQDTLQSAQAGYRDRIVHVALKKEEGGLNLELEAAAVQRMVNVGRLAGQRLLKFELGAHRWRRFLSLTDMIERDFAEIAERWHGSGQGPEHGPQETFAEFVARHGPHEQHYPPPAADGDWLADAAAFYNRVTDLAESDVGKRLSERMETPRPRTDLKARPRL